jgi:hypothetical protein
MHCNSLRTIPWFRAYDDTQISTAAGPLPREFDQGVRALAIPSPTVQALAEKLLTLYSHHSHFGYR